MSPATLPPSSEAPFTKPETPPTMLYKPLDQKSNQFRLLRLPEYDPSTASTSWHEQTEIQCELFETYLDKCPGYAALSYTWESSNPAAPTTFIKVNGQDKEVGENLAFALFAITAFRKDTMISTLWVDAICIDQESTQERNRQIGQMGEIYRKAYKVHAWLVRDVSVLMPGISLADRLYGRMGENFDIDIRYAGHNFDVDDKISIIFGDGSWLNNIDKADTSTSGPYLRELQCLAQRCNLPFWSRLWIVQEVLLGKDVDLWFGDDAVYQYQSMAFADIYARGN